MQPTLNRNQFELQWNQLGTNSELSITLYFDGTKLKLKEKNMKLTLTKNQL